MSKTMHIGKWIYFAILTFVIVEGITSRRGIVPYFFVTVIVIVTVIMISAMFIF